jgi:trk system potassium uptake protein TrkH
MAAVSKLAPVVTVLGMVTMLFSFTMLLPLTLSWLSEDGALWIYDEAIVITFGAGFAMWITTRHLKRELAARDGYLLASLIWAVLPAFATLPLMLHLPNLSFTDAYFETMSGITTTGATVLTGLDALPKSINLWRHQLNWMGGMGIIVLAVAIFPLLGIGGMQLFKAETPGPMKDDKLTPRITETAKNLWLVYFIITLACIGSLMWAGMDWFDAICHAFSAMGLGGFSTHDASIGHFNSPLIEYVLIIFMLIAGMNFATHFLAWRGKSLRVYLDDPEAKVFLLLVLGSCIGIAWYIWMKGVFNDYWVALRYASFNLVSLATSSGFANIDYNSWPIFATIWMLYLSTVSTCSGSTGGGIKMVRTIVTFNQAVREMKRQVHPNAMLPLRLGKQVLDNRVVFAVQTFVLVYCTLLIFLSMILMASGLDLVSSLSAAIACINNTGPGLNVVGPASNYSSLTDFQTWVCTFAMLVGRLELFTLLVLITPAFWRK